MTWILQTPDAESPTLFATILAECKSAVRGGAAFAFASERGVKLLASEPAFNKFLKTSEFSVVVGLDAITDTRAVDELRKLRSSLPNFKPKLFLHKKGGSLFHPKTLWLKTATGGLIITGSGNLTPGGLKSNWEALAVEKVSFAEIDAAERSWNKWLAAHKEELRDLDDPKAAAKANENRKLRAKIKKAIEASETDAGETEVEAAAQGFEEIEQELIDYPVLIAELPKGSTRWEQANFTKKSFVEFFGVKDKPKTVRFSHVQPSGSLTPEALRPSVSVKSRNFRFELSAAKGLPYPPIGVPIAIFERISDSDFHYILLMPEDKAHRRVTAFLDKEYPKKSRILRRIQITSNDLQKVWPEAPFFL
jgi:HKD family nuclease